MYRYFNRIAVVGSGNYIYFWKSKGLSDERINTITTSNYNITPELSHYGTKVRLKFIGSCLKQDKATFGAVSLTKHADIDQYKYSGYGIGFDRKGEFSFGSNGFGRNVIILGADVSSSVHAYNKTK